MTLSEERARFYDAHPEGHNAALPGRVDVAGIKLVELVARSAATGNEALPVTWGEAALTGR